MATIRRAGNRIITKVVNGQRRVSCSCCETGECCPYPAQGLIDGLYTEQDLPDQILVYVDDELNYGPADRVGQEFVWTFVIEGVPIPAKIKINPDVIFDAGAAWALELDGQFTFGPEVCTCLFGVCFPEYGAEDTFADTYTVERRTETLTGPPDATFTITRESLCRWCGFDPLLESTICLEYNAPTFAGQGHWSIGGFGEAPPRNNSSPAGNYADGGSIWMVLEP